MKEINKEDVLKAIKKNIIKNKETSNKVAKIAIEEILNDDKEINDKINKKFSKKEDNKNER